MARKPTVPAHQAANQAASPLGDILGALLGGGQTSGQPSSQAKPKPGSSAKPKPKPKPSSQEQAGGLDMGSLLGGLLGGGASSSASSGGLDLGGLLGSLLGGGSSSTTTGSSSPLKPLIDSLAAKMGIPPQIAEVVVTMLLSKMAAGQQATRMPGGAGLNLDDLAGTLNASGGVDQSYVNSTGMVEELVQKTGLDAETASRSLTTALNMMSQPAPAANTAARKKRPRS